METNINTLIKDLKNNPYDHYIVLHHLRGNLLQIPFAYYSIYLKDKRNEDLITFKKETKIIQEQHNVYIKMISQRAKENHVKPELLNLIKTIQKESNFDWTNINKLRSFNKEYGKILNIIEKLK